MRRRAGAAGLITLLVASLLCLVLVRWEQSASSAVAQLIGPRRTPADASADAYTRRDAPGANAGKAATWYAGGRAKAQRRAYLKFAVGAPRAGSHIVQATLYAYVLTARSETAPGLTLWRTSRHWTEGGLTWRDQPPLLERVAATNGAYTDGSWVGWDVTGYLPRKVRHHGGVVSFAVTTHERRSLPFGARESADPPRLVVTTRGGSGEPRDGVEAATTHRWGPVIAGDEFNDYTGAPDSAMWATYNSAGHDGEGRRSPDAWSVGGGVATVSGDRAGTTGGMSERFNQSFGGWEIRMRTSARDPKYHPVLLLWPQAGTGATTCPEIDFAEASRDTTRMYFYNHYGCHGVHTWTRQEVDTTQWHNYAVRWTPRAVTGYIDGVKWFTDTDVSHQSPVPMHAAMQLDWHPDGYATTPSQMQIDWVRVYAPPSGR
ncbi:MAG: hypothetical protein QOK15_213 [Nocardioidaceae bacterium]|nr:hypothetical protein [Nocardioidaceae bacterium]